MFPFVQMAEKHGDVATHHNPTALRKAKTPWSFGHSECSRVKALQKSISNKNNPITCLKDGQKMTKKKKKNVFETFPLRMKTCEHTYEIQHIAYMSM